MSSQIWTEKYRPQRFDDLVGQREIVSRVRALVGKKTLPHCLFSGPAGVGKTTLALIVAKELFGPSWKDNFLELNASDDRGINVVRNEIKDFARTMALANVPHKIIFLDECDSLTKEAQQALRRTMEQFSKTTRFILSCNYSSKLIDPIKSRCSLFRFKPLTKDDAKIIVGRICEKEQINVNENAFNLLYEFSAGDARKLGNLLQSCAAITDKIDENIIGEMVEYATPKDVLNILDLSITGSFIEARKKLLDVMLNQGLSGLDIIKQIQQTILVFEVEDDKKYRMIEKCAEIEFRMVEGSDEFVQLEALIAYFATLKNDVGR